MTDTSSELAEEVSHLLLRAVGLSRAELDRAFADHGISEQHMVLLRKLYVGGPLSMRSISQLLGTEPSTVTSTVDKLERRGLLERGGDPHDRRVKLIGLTALGSALVDDVWTRMARLTPVGRLEDHELRALRTLLITMIGPLPPDAPWTF